MNVWNATAYCMDGYLTESKCRSNAVLKIEAENGLSDKAKLLNSFSQFLALALCLFVSVYSSASATSVAFVGAKIYPGPDLPSIESGVIVVVDGIITAIGPVGHVEMPNAVKTINVIGKTITAGLWNSHVHFNVPPLDTLSQEDLTAYVRDMLLSRGFLYVLDTGSMPGTTAEIRRRIESGEIAGPRILVAGGSLVPAGASPFYLRPNVLPDAALPEHAQAQIDMAIQMGADAIKIYSGSIVGLSERGPDVVPMDVAVVKGIADAAHARDLFVIAHPSNNSGAWAAVRGGVDILAHTFPQEGWDRTLPSEMVDRGVALIPTLKLWRYEGERFELPEDSISNSIRIAQEQVFAVSLLGGEILFGTDVGYMSDFDPTAEYRLMQEAGLSFEQILASLTTAPAKRFGMAARVGRLTPGRDADLVILPLDPVDDITSFAKPETVVQRGEVVFRHD